MSKDRRPGIPIPFGHHDDSDSFSDEQINKLPFIVSGTEQSRIRELAADLEAERLAAQRYESESQGKGETLEVVKAALKRSQHLSILLAVLLGLAFAQNLLFVFAQKH